ncbi:MAG: nitroreductase family protein [Bacteroidia bacterium]|nr:nitroreductase family protein [Bacteroidia bacterium]
MGVQRFTGKAAVNFVYVADYSKMIAISKDTKDFYSTADTGFISQNVYLFCASEGLATVVLGWIKRDKMSEILKLKKDQHIILSQSVGYPADIQEIPTMEE